MTNLSFQEKSLWITLVGMIAVFTPYFVTAIGVAHSSPSTPVNVTPPHITLFVTAVVVLALISVVGHVLIAIVDRNTRTDERDRQIALRGSRIAGYVLATGVFLSLCAAIVIPGNFAFTHLLLAFWVLAQTTEIVSQLAMYRRAA